MLVPRLGALFVLLASISQASEPILQLDTGGHTAKIQELLHTPDGSALVSASNDKVVRIWDLGQGKTVRTIRGEIGPGPEGMVYAMALSRDGNWLAVGGWMRIGGTGRHGDIRLFDFDTGRLAAILSAHERVVYDLEFSPDDTRLVSAGADHKAIVWDLRSRRPVVTLNGHHKRITQVTFTGDGQRIVTASDDQTLRLWNAADGSALAVMHGHTGKVRALAASPVAALVASGGYDRRIRLWDDLTGTALGVLAKQPTQVISLSFSADGRRLLSGVGAGPDNDVHVWSVPDGHELLRYGGHDNIVLATTFSADGRYAATGGGNRREIHLWSVADGQAKRILGGTGDAIWTVAFSGDGSRLAWSKTHPCPEPPACFAPPPLEYAITLPERDKPFGPPRPLSDYSAFLYGQASVDQWSLVARTTSKRGWPDVLDIYGNGAVQGTIGRGPSNGFRHNAFTFTPDGKFIISGGMNGELAVYDQKGRLMGELTGHTGDIWSVAVSPDGQLVASGSADQTVKLWNLAERKNLLTLFHGRDDEWVAWTPSGYYTSSPEGDRHVGWHLNRGHTKEAEFFPAHQFRNLKKQPDIVEDTLVARSEAVAVERWQRLGRVQPAQSVGELIASVPSRPKLLSSPRGTVDLPTQTFVVQVGANTEHLLVTVNGRPARSGNHTGGEETVTHQVRLDPGRNTVAFVARNRSGDSKIVRTILEYAPSQSATALPDWRKPVLYLLSIGVAEYADTSLNLGYPDDDVQALVERLQQEKGGIYGDVRVKELVNAQATRADVLDALSFLEQMTQDDLAVLFIAGHGKQDNKGDFFFLPHDVDHERLRSTGVKWVEFKNLLGSLPGKVLLLADACHSADIFGGNARRAVLDMSRLATEFTDAEAGVIVFTSSQGKEFSLESSAWGHGAFTKALLDGLNGEADYDDDGVIHQSELELYVKRRVVKLTNGQQHPITIRPGAMPDFPLAIVPAQSG